jgi:hypothetical protein
MKLPNFYNFEPMNILKQRMGIPRDRYGTLDIEVQPPRLSAESLEKLGKEGLDVSFSQLRFLDDGTVAFEGRRVLVYIRDRSQFNGLPKFHFASCSTLVAMHSNQKIDKYVVATRMDGLFDLNITGFGGKTKTTSRLAVCKNCLERLNYKGYYHSLPNATKAKLVSSFSISEFFDEYSNSLIDNMPIFNADNAPINDYSDDWDQISLAYRESVHWTCENEQCGRVLSPWHLRQYLHTHHRNGKKYDNKRPNLMALCIECHAEQPDHAQLKASPQYTAFAALGVR